MGSERTFGQVHVMAICAFACLAWATVVSGQSDGKASDEPLPDVSAADLIASARSEVRIIARENHQVKEYRAGGNVYKIKVTPKNAPPYYLVDEDGSGNLQWKRGPDLERESVPHWAVFKW